MKKLNLVLIVDSHPQWRELLVDILRRDNDLYSTATKLDAEQIAKEKEFTYAIVDIQLDETNPRNSDGLQLVDYLIDRKIPLIILSQDSPSIEQIRWIFHKASEKALPIKIIDKFEIGEDRTRLHDEINNFVARIQVPAKLKTAKRIEILKAELSQFLNSSDLGDQYTALDVIKKQLVEEELDPLFKCELLKVRDELQIRLHREHEYRKKRAEFEYLLQLRRKEMEYESALRPGLSNLDIPKDYMDRLERFRHELKRLEEENKKELSFTAFHPKEGGVETWHTLLVYAHITSALATIQEDAKKFFISPHPIRETTATSSILILREAELTIVPFCENVTFNPESATFKWMEDFHRAEFRFKADHSLSNDAAKGQITIYVGPLIIGTLKFAMLFNDTESQPVPDHEENTKMYGRDDVFISYSRKDTEVAYAFKTILSATGMDVFIDVDNLKSGQLWQDELLHGIERARIFQVFWSENYSQSENCKMEWEHALKQNKDEGYIRPVYWKTPLSPKPPEELGKFNFQYVKLSDFR